MKRFLAKDSSEIYYINDYHGHPNYKIIYFLLLLLMFITVIPELVNALYGKEVIPHSTLVILGIFFLSTVKATLVVFKFMHMQFEHRFLLISFFLCLILLLILYVLLFLDISKLAYENYHFTEYHHNNGKEVEFLLDIEKIEKLLKS